MKNITFQQIEYFLETVKCSSFSQAAKNCYTTESNISKNIRSLENALGEKLFIRQKNGVLPTQKAVLLSLELSDSKSKIYSLFGFETNPRTNNKISIGFCQSIFFPEAIPNLFKLFQKPNLFTDSNFELHCLEVNEVIDKVINGSIDLGFILSDLNITKPQLKMKTVLSSNPKIYYSVNCPLSKLKTIHVQDFENYPIITTKYLIEQNGYQMINCLPFNPRSIKIIDNYDEIKLYLATGLYITVLRPYVSLAYNIAIKSFTLPDYELSQGINAIWLSNNNNPYLEKVLKIFDKTSS